jgi:Uma2 family endonuclease
MLDTKLPVSDISKTSTPAEQRVVFYDISWSAYEQILTALGDRRCSRLIYNQGTLEITMPSREHETAVRMIELFIRILIEELNLEMITLGSTTLNRPDIEKGAEPDNCFYIQNQPQVAGKKIDLTQGPPPDLIVEVDITHTDINKLSLYASIGVPEFWRYDGRILRIYQLVENQYIEVEDSIALSRNVKELLNQFLQDCQVSEVRGSKNFRAYIQQEIREKT